MIFICIKEFLGINYFHFLFLFELGLVEKHTFVGSVILDFLLSNLFGLDNFVIAVDIETFDLDGQLFDSFGIGSNFGIEVAWDNFCFQFGIRFDILLDSYYFDIVEADIMHPDFPRL